MQKIGVEGPVRWAGSILASVLLAVNAQAYWCGVDAHGLCLCEGQQFVDVVPDGLPCAGSAVIFTTFIGDGVGDTVADAGPGEQGRTEIVRSGHCIAFATYECDGVGFGPYQVLTDGQQTAGSTCQGPIEI
jgi:hypothetical protein